MKNEIQPQITVREAHPSDQEAIVQFQIEMAWETEKVRLKPETIKSGVRAVFDNPHLGRYFVTENNGEVIASLMVTYEWSDWRNSLVWWLQSVYVIPQYRRHGVFRKMYEHIRSLVIENENVAGIRLYMIHHNEVAGRVYEQMGMDGNHYRLFEWMKS